MESKGIYNPNCKMKNDRAHNESSQRRLAFIASLRCVSCSSPITFRTSSVPKWKDIKKRRFCHLCYRRENNRARRGITISARGYVYIWVADRNVMEHVHKAEQVLGRRLQKNEVVHHINGITTDNRNSNLLITTRGEHHLLHRKMARLYKQEHPEFSGPDKVADKFYMKEHFCNQEGV